MRTHIGKACKQSDDSVPYQIEAESYFAAGIAVRARACSNIDLVRPLQFLSMSSPLPTCLARNGQDGPATRFSCRYSGQGRCSDTPRGEEAYPGTRMTGQRGIAVYQRGGCRYCVVTLRFLIICANMRPSFPHRDDHDGWFDPPACAISRPSILE